MQIEIDKPLAGFLKINIADSSQSFSDSLSYTPDDFIYKLIETLNLVSLSNAKGEFVLNGYSESDIHNFIFEIKEDDILFSITRKEKEGYEILFQKKEQKEKLLLTFYRAISKMKSRLSNVDYKNNWHNDFPEIKFQNLKNLLKNK